MSIKSKKIEGHICSLLLKMDVKPQYYIIINQFS